MNEIYIDVGVMKSGTKFREYILYPAIKEIKLYTFPFSKHNPMYLNYNTADKIVLVDESLSGRLYRPECDVLKERNNSINNMKRCFPKANIIICTRKGESFIKSAYRQYVFSGGIDKFDSWYDRINKKVFDFDDYIKSLRNSFNNVLVLDFELLKEDTNTFAKKLCGFMGVEIPIFKNRKLNASLSDRQTNVWRLCNHLWKTHENQYGIPAYRFFRKIVERIGVKQS
jgi:hypothetical protein